MHTQFILPALALLAPLVTAQQEDTPIVSAFIEYMEAEGFSSLNAGGFTREASQYSILIDSIEGVLATAAPSDKSFVESYVSEAVFADPTLSSVMASITSEYGDDDATPAPSSDATDSAASATADGAATSAASSQDGATAVDARYMGVASAMVGAAVLGFAVLL